MVNEESVLRTSSSVLRSESGSSNQQYTTAGSSELLGLSRPLCRAAHNHRQPQPRHNHRIVGSGTCSWNANAGPQFAARKASRWNSVTSLLTKEGGK